MASKKARTPARTADNKVSSATTAATSSAPVAVTPAPVAAAVAAPVTVAKPVAAPAVVAAAPAAPVAAPVAPVAAVAPAPTKVEAVRDRSSIVGLIGKLRDADAEIARDAAVTLGGLPADAEAIDALCAVVRNTERYFHPVVRAAAATTLGRLGDKRAVEALIVGTGDTMAEASEESIRALGLLGDARAVKTLETIVRNEQDFYIAPVVRTAEGALVRLTRKA